MKAASRLVLVVGAICALVVMENVSQATIIAADTFTRADGETANDSLGNTEVGGYHWFERWLGNTGGAMDVASVTGTELAFAASGPVKAMLNIDMSDASASVDVRFINAPSGTTTSKSLGMVFRQSDMDAHTNLSVNTGTVTAQVTSSGGLMIGERQTAGFSWLYLGNPFNSLVDYCTYGDAYSLPSTYGSGNFDTNHDGRLTSDEAFQLGVILSGTSLEVQINGLAIETVTLENTGGATSNYFALMRNHLGGTEDYMTGAFDNLTLSNVPEPSALALVVSGLLGLLCYAWRRRK